MGVEGVGYNCGAFDSLSEAEKRRQEERRTSKKRQEANENDLENFEAMLEENISDGNEEASSKMAKLQKSEEEAAAKDFNNKAQTSDDEAKSADLKDTQGALARNKEKKPQDKQFQSKLKKSGQEEDTSEITKKAESGKRRDNKGSKTKEKTSKSKNREVDKGSQDSKNADQDSSNQQNLAAEVVSQIETPGDRMLASTNKSNRSLTEEAIQEIADAVESFLVEEPSQEGGTDPSQKAVIIDLKSEILEDTQIKLTQDRASTQVTISMGSSKSAQVLRGGEKSLKGRLEALEQEGREIEVRFEDYSDDAGKYGQV